MQPTSHTEIEPTTSPPTTPESVKQEFLLDKFLGAAVKQGASDIHMVPDKQPCFRLHGTLRPLDTEVATTEGAQTFAKTILSMNSTAEAELTSVGEADGAIQWDIKGELRNFRYHISKTTRGLKTVIRVVDSVIRQPEELGLPQELVELTQSSQGLVLITGQTGSGKSTTAAGLIDWNLRNRPLHVVTVEQPPEYIFQHHKGIVSQVDVPNNFRTFSGKIRGVMREDPDMIFVGELRDYETAEAALNAAMSGHLVISTLHTGSAAKSIDRIINIFPENLKDQALDTLTSCLSAVFTQRLLKRADGEPERVLAYEFLNVQNNIRNMIAKRNEAGIYSAMQTGGRVGMRTLETSLAALVDDGVISAKVAMQQANRKDALKSLLE